MNRSVIILFLATVLVVSFTQSCDPPCNSCSLNSTLTSRSVSKTCLSCVNGYYLSNGVCLSCQVQYCATCTGPNQCTSCISSFVLNNGACQCADTYSPFPVNASNATCACGGNPNNINCTNCSVSNCLACNQNNFCNNCANTYVVTKSGTCYSFCPITNCLNCSSQNFCSNCSGNLVPSSTGGACVSCVTNNCQSCSNSGVCASYNSGYKLTSDGKCLNCNIQNCKSCISNGVCSECISGFQLSANNTCFACSYPCSTCNANSTCQTCVSPPYSNYPLSANQTSCFTCSVTNCLTCQPTTPSICTQCAALYTLSANQTVCALSCTQNNCQTCQNGNSTFCVTCMPSYAINSQDGTCSLCKGGLSCVVCNLANTSICTQCANGFYLSNGVCLACPSYCQTCTSLTACSVLNNPTGQTITIINGTSYLAVCNQGCTSCSPNNPNYCIVCGYSYYLSNGMCLPCGSNCQTCNASAPSQCFTCFPNYYLIANGSSQVCQTCASSSNCLTCAAFNLAVCTSCPQGSLISATGTCIAGCPLNCVSCSNPFQCTLCLYGYTLVANGTCLPCLAGCSYCSSTQIGNCLNCGYGSFLNTQTNLCQTCSSFCLSCNSLGCISCSSGYYLTSSFTCAPNCVSPCSTCSASSPNQCTGCIAGYTLNGNVCNPDLNCAGNGEVCSVCPFGSFLNTNQQCTACANNLCARCSANNSQNCLSCNLGYYLVNSTGSTSSCAACALGCSNCLGNLCFACIPGYTSFSVSMAIATQVVSCLACISPCLNCMGTPEICTSCVSSYYLQNNKCVSNFNFQISITLQTDFATFTTNYYQFLQALANTVDANINAVVLNSLISGSVTTNGYVINTASPQTPTSQNYYYNLNGLLNGGAIAGMSIQSSNLVVNGGNALVPESDNTTLILAICIPVGVVILVAIGVLIYWKKKKDSSTIQQKMLESQKSSGRRPSYVEMELDSTRKVEVI